MISPKVIVGYPKAKALDPNKRTTQRIPQLLAENEVEIVTRPVPALPRTTGFHSPRLTREPLARAISVSEVTAENPSPPLPTKTRTLSIPPVIKIFLGTLVLCLGLALLPSTKLPAPAVVEKASTAIAVTVLDPTLSKEEIAEPEKPALVEEEKLPGFDASAQAKTQNFDLANRTFSFVGEPKLASGASYIAASDAPAKSTLSHVGKIGLLPVPAGVGRYIGKNGIEWQGGWELGNPSGNAERGAGYLEYLKKNFSENIEKSIVVEDKSVGKSAIPMTPPAERPSEILHYSK